ncbi:MAG: hypothetical protein ACR2PO_04805 [Methyloligellaceae bacterium]
MRYVILTAATLGLTTASLDFGHAGAETYCVICKGPDQAYTCRVDTSKANPGLEALQLYCIVKTARDGGHKSCSATRQTATNCKGALRTYTYKGPSLSPRARQAVGERLAPAGSDAAGNSGADKPKTLMQFGSRAVKASGRGLRKAAGRTGQAVGNVTKNTGQRVSGAARSAGGRVGTAARTAYDCVKSLFRKCRSSSGEDSGAPEPKLNRP